LVLANTVPTVSVIVPSFNSPFLKETVDSVLAQSFQSFEVIIVDCSTDSECLGVLDEIAHSKVKIFRRPEQHFPGDNRNYGVERASGEFMVCLDADDLIDPTFLEEALFAICCVDYAMVGTSVHLFGVLNKKVKMFTHPTVEQLLKMDGFVVTNLHRVDLWNRLGGQKDTGLRADHVPEDWDFMLRAVATGATLYNRGTYGLHYRKHYSSITAQQDLMDWDDMTARMRERYPELYAGLDTGKAQTPPTIDENGWRRLLTSGKRRETAGLVLLPEQVNESFIDGLKKSIAGISAPPVVISTCEMDSYPAEFLSWLRELKSELFSLPDFLEQRQLWLEFISYLGATRNIPTIWYGQNAFFVENLDAVSKTFPDAALNYISRYAVPAPSSRTREGSMAS